VPQPPPALWPHGVALLMAFLDGVGTLALLMVCYFLYRAYRLSGARLLLFFLLGFTALAASEVARTLMLLAAFAARRPLLAFFLAHAAGPVPIVGQSVAFLLVAVGYAAEAAGARASARPAAALVPLALALALQRLWRELYLVLAAVNAALLTFILLNAIVVYLSSRSRDTLLPVVAFSLFLASNLLLAAAVTAWSEEAFVLHKLLYIGGLLALLALALRVARA